MAHSPLHQTPKSPTVSPNLRFQELKLLTREKLKSSSAESHQAISSLSFKRKPLQRNAPNDDPPPALQVPKKKKKNSRQSLLLPSALGQFFEKLVHDLLLLLQKNVTTKSSIHFQKCLAIMLLLL
jgi:hypothetical protein